jgi:hypothetical protein
MTKVDPIHFFDRHGHSTQSNAFLLKRIEELETRNHRLMTALAGVRRKIVATLDDRRPPPTLN